VADHDWLVDRFEAHRAHLQAVAYRMLGSQGEADDAVQEAWFRLNRSDTTEIENLGGWLTTVVARVCLDMLRSRQSRREDPLEAHEIEAPGVVVDPEQQAVLSDSVGLALLVVLDTLSPAERLAFVLHDLFGVSFEEIAPVVDRTPEAARQLASRARRRVRGGAVPEDRSRKRAIVDAFLAASREGDFEALVRLLDPDAAVRADAAVVAMGGDAEVRGAVAVAEYFVGRARGARPALVDGGPALVWSQRGQPRVVFAFEITDGVISAIDLIADRDRLAAFEIELGN
jgi:RNA polymerase sigma-70 factor, ECF subfamily